MDDRDAPTEIELTLRLSPEAAERLKRHRGLARWRNGRSLSRRLVATYYDTPELALRGHQIALRVRKIGARHIQTVKQAPNAEAGLLRRLEDEIAVPGQAPDVHLVTQKKLRRLLAAPGIAPHLRPTFVTDFRRLTVPLEVGDSLVEMAVDRGEISADGSVRPICEVELELKHGRVGALYEVARALAEVVPVAIEPLSKAERGYELITGERPQPRRAEPLDLDRECTIGDAFELIGRNCLMQLRANVASAQAAVTPEGVHQLRVSIRRLRSALHAFRKLLPDEERRRVVAMVRWIMQVCAPARAWDVFVAECLDPLREHLPEDAPHDALQGFTADVEQMQADAHARVEALLADPRFTASCLELESWWESGTARSMLGGAADLPLLPFARDTIRALARRLHTEAEAMAERGAEELHDVRIRAKKLRYTAEFLRSLFRRKAAKAYLGALADLQDRLGSINDAITARTLLDDLERVRPPSDAEDRARARALIAGWASARIAEDLRAVPGLWEAFAALKPFWR